MFKKGRIILLTIIITMLLLIIPINIKATTNVLQVSNTAFGAIRGSEFETTIFIEEGSNVTGLTITLTYDSKLVTLKDYEELDASEVNVIDNTIIIVYSGADNISDQLDLVNLTFEVEEQIGKGNYDKWLYWAETEDDEAFTTDGFIGGRPNYVDLDIQTNFTPINIRAKGDAYDNKGDGKINSRDASYILQHAAHMFTMDIVEQYYANVYEDYDNNGNPKVSARDASLILQYAAHMDVEINDRYEIVFYTLNDNNEYIKYITKSIKKGEVLVNIPVVENINWSTSPEEYIEVDYNNITSDTNIYAYYGEVHKHTVVIDPKVEATCTEDGLTEGSHCLECGEVIISQELIEALGHDEVNHEGKQPTCTEVGYTSYVTCTRCSYTTYEEIPVISHNFVDMVCENCGAREGSIGLKYTLLSNGTYEVSGIGTCTDTEIIIPSTYNNKNVTSIGYCAFYNCTNIKEIKIADSVTSIDEKAFENCVKLTSVIISNSVTSIGYRAFYNCSNLTSIAIPSSVTSIESEVFSNCLCLESIEIPNSITIIKSLAFYNCISLTNITIPSSVVNMESEVFSNCVSLESIEIAEGVTSIWSNAFNGCTNLVNITIPSSITSIEGRVFRNCTSLTNVYYEGTIEQWMNISFASWDSNPMYYASNFFMLDENSEWYKPTEIVIPSTITSINDYTFYNWNSLTKVEIPSSITSIGIEAFYNCTSLTNVYYEGTIEQWMNISFSNYISNPMWYASNFFMKDENNEWYKPTEIVIPSSITSINAYTFFNWESLTKVEIPNSVTSIGIEAFRNCYSLVSIRIPGSVTSIGNSAFNNCTSLESIEIPNSVTSIGVYAFKNCTSLRSVTIPSSITSIGYYTFNNCTSLVYIEIPSSVTSIGWYAFYNCTSSTIYCEAASQPDGWYSNWNYSNCPVVWDYKNTIDHICFKDTSMTKVYPTCVTEGYDLYTCNVCGQEYKFNVKETLDHTYEGSSCIYCDYPLPSVGLEYMEYDTTCTVVGIGTCEDSNIVIPKFFNGKRVVSIAERAFYNCSTIEKIILPDSITEIGNQAFSNCISLEDILISKNVTNIGWRAFYNCPNLIICCEALEQQEEWSYGWNDSQCIVIWGYNTIIDHICLYESTITTVFPTCTTNGYDIYICNKCGQENRINITEKTEHTYENDLCTVCGVGIKLEELINKVQDKLEENGIFDKIKYFPFGDLTRENGNVLPLPKKISDLTSDYPEYADVDIIWTANEEGLLDEDYKLLKQYLRYHEVVLSYSISLDGYTATLETVINVGIAEKEHTVYVGGFFATDQKEGGIIAGDALTQLSKFDGPQGKLTKRGLTYGSTYGYAMFGGYTYYIDLTDEEGVVTRYQFYVQLGTIVEIDEEFSIDPVTGKNPVLNADVQKYFGSGNNWSIFFVNKTNQTIKIPLSPLANSGEAVFVDPVTGATVQYKSHPFYVERENSVSFDGYRTGFVTNENGKVVLGNGEGIIQNVTAKTTNVDDMENYWVEIPANGYGMSYKTQCNNAAVTGKFCEMGNSLTIQYFDPYYTSVDGVNESDPDLYKNLWS